MLIRRANSAGDSGGGGRYCRKDILIWLTFNLLWKKNA